MGEILFLLLLALMYVYLKIGQAEIVGPIFEIETKRDS